MIVKSHRHRAGLTVREWKQMLIFTMRPPWPHELHDPLSEWGQELRIIQTFLRDDLAGPLTFVVGPAYRKD